MIKIKIPYERPEELERLVKRLEQDMKRIKVSKHQEGKFSNCTFT